MTITYCRPTYEWRIKKEWARDLLPSSFETVSVYTYMNPHTSNVQYFMPVSRLVPSGIQWVRKQPTIHRVGSVDGAAFFCDDFFFLRFFVVVHSGSITAASLGRQRGWLWQQFYNPVVLSLVFVDPAPATAQCRLQNLKLKHKKKEEEEEEKRKKNKNNNKTKKKKPSVLHTRYKM